MRVRDARKSALLTMRVRDARENALVTMRDRVDGANPTLGPHPEEPALAGVSKDGHGLDLPP
jgi:hypothetical protein